MATWFKLDSSWKSFNVLQLKRKKKKKKKGEYGCGSVFSRCLLWCSLLLLAVQHVLCPWPPLWN